MAENKKIDDSALEQVTGGELDPFRDTAEIVRECTTNPEPEFPNQESRFDFAKRNGCRVFEIKGIDWGRYATADSSIPLLLPGDHVYVEPMRDGMYGCEIQEKIEEL